MISIFAKLGQDFKGFEGAEHDFVLINHVKEAFADMLKKFCYTVLCDVYL